MILTFVSGTLELRGLAEGDLRLPAVLNWDPRTKCYRAEAMHYATVILGLRRAEIAIDDQARRYDAISGVKVHREPRPYQREAFDAWWSTRLGRGLVVLPTGAGKTHVAVMAIDKTRRSTLVVAPTLDLVRQWYDTLRTSFDEPVGIVGGGHHEIAPLTVTTYDSAYLHMDHLGNRFGLVVFDEAHHLPSAGYAIAARTCLAPFRLGLTATPERVDDGHLQLDLLIGPLVYRKDIHELKGEFLADYETERIIVQLSAEERAEYDECRGIYRAFVSDQGIQMGSPAGFGEFIMRAARSEEGRTAMAAYRRHKELAFTAKEKLEVVARLLHLHRRERTIVFTQDNATAYRVSRDFLLPVITHQTKIKERSQILELFSAGTYTAVVTSKVLNEGVDVPDASIAIVLSGSGSVREHVQRLGRVLRKRGDKRAILYELVAAETSETYTSERRREHVAYR